MTNYQRPMTDDSLDILALAAHRDDVEQTCGGTLLKMAERGYRTGILDLTQGEMGTRGTAEDRAREASDAARILKVSWREALDIPDGRVENTWENRLKVVRVLREAASARADPSLLGRASSRSLHGFGAGIRSGVLVGTGEISRQPSAVSRQHTSGGQLSAARIVHSRLSTPASIATSAQLSSSTSPTSSKGALPR